MLLRPLRRGLVAVFVLFAFLLQGTFALAGTTGSLSGTATDATTNAPIAGAKVTAASPSQVSTTTTDSSGRFSFLSLIPDTYIVSIQQQGYEDTSISGVTITADNARTLSVTAAKALKVIGRVTTRSAGSLVKPGTTTDVYSIDSTAQSKASVAGGGGTQNSAFSALSTVPGVFVAPGQSGYIGAGPSLSIRGGDYDQIGYEIDGVPVNRAFDNYPSGPASSLGQQELQVYTGGGPASSEAQGLSGFINQVIKTGTNPGFIYGDLAIGGPTFYHKAALEIGGASANRNFSYYIGVGGYDQDFRYVDQYNGAGIGQLFGTAIAPCAAGVGAAVAPSCYAPNGVAYGTGVNAYNAYFGTINSYLLGGANLFATSQVIDRDNVINLHYDIERKSGLKDDIQVLGMVNALKTYYYDSTNDLGGAAFLAANGYSGPTGVPYFDGLIYNGPTGTVLPANYQSLITTQNFPHSADPTGRVSGASIIPANLEDDTVNDQGILKLQLTHPFSQNALLKLYGYTYYSDWLQTGPQSTYADFYGPSSPDYELSSHTRGISGAFIDQINPQNLLQLQGSYTTSNALRDNNTGFLDAFGGGRSNFATLVSSANPTNGLCYATGGGAPIACGGAYFTLQQAQAGLPAPTGICGGSACEYLVTGNGQYATYNTVKPIFYSGSLTDDFHPTSKLAINGGIRMDIFQYQGSNTQGTAARTLYYNAFNLDNCLDSSNLLVAKDPLAACPAGTTPANFQDPAGIVTESYTEFQPRLGFTYSVDPSTVLRANYGRYSQAPNSAYQQYNTLQQNAPGTLYGTYGFQQFGFTSPDHTVRPPTSNNYDFSFEHAFPGQVSIKVSPFLRKTADQIQNFYLNQQTGFVSGLNVGRQTSDGIEFELDKGDFNRDGLSAKVSFTYTNSYINYQTLSNGSSIITPLNTSIAAYNSYTSACAPGGAAFGKTLYGQPICGTNPSGVAASPCYTPAIPGTATTALVPGTAAACGGGTIANPYWTAPVQGLLNPNGNYPTYDTFPAGVGSSVTGYGAPFTGTLILNYKKGPFALTPVFQMFGGQRYGAPNSTNGINPELCSGALAGSTTGDSRYPYGAAGGAPFDATTCAVNGFSIPDPYTKTFDGIGAFVAPTEAELNLQFTYEVSKNLTLVTNVTNLINECFGGTKVGFSVSGACGYSGTPGGGSSGDIGNQYNPGATIQPYTNTPYLPFFGSNTNPISVYVNAQLKL
jgi:hypothetical protein